jgi:hypothetical protein
MRTTFLRSLLVVAVVQFVITRYRAGQAYEEGEAERMWMLYPVSVVMNALMWTLLIRGTARVLRLIRSDV